MNTANTLTTTKQANTQAIVHAVDVATNLASSTKKQYKRELVKAVDAGVNLLDAAQVADYAATLSTSSRNFLAAAIRKFVKRIELEVKANATPDNAQNVTATLYRLDALNSAIEREQPKGQKAHTWLSVADVRQLMRTPKLRTKQRDTVALALLLQAGLRRSEAVGLRWRDVVAAGDNWQLSITGKGDKARVVPIKRNVAQLLFDWKERCEASEDERILRGLAKGERLTDSISPQQLYNIVAKAGKRIGKPELAPHDLRRTYAETLRQQGIDIAVISKLLGHSSVETTMRYLNVQIDDSAVVELPLY